MAASEPVIDKLRNCPVLATLDVMGGKWQTRILWHLRDGPRHFGDLRRSIRVSEKVLAENLKALQRNDLISRTEATAAGVLTTRYDYTPYGRTLIPVLDAMGAWGVNHAAKGRSDGQHQE